MAYRRRIRDRSLVRRRPGRRATYSLAKYKANDKIYVRSVPRGIALKSHHFKQTYFPTAGSVTTTGGGSYTANSGIIAGPTTAGAADFAWSLKFIASDLPQFASFATIFDTYRINRVVVKLVPCINSVTSSATATTEVGASQQFMTTVIDYDDSTNLTAYTQALEYESFKETPMYRTHKRVLTPKLSQEAYKTSGTTIGFLQKGKQWVDAAYGDVEHYGIKSYIVYNAGHIQQQWKMFVTMYISFKQVR